VSRIPSQKTIATSRTTKVYSTKPCPSSSSQSRVSNVIAVPPVASLCLIFNRWGKLGAIWVPTVMVKNYNEFSRNALNGRA
jgi:hypothetical protein